MHLNQNLNESLFSVITLDILLGQKLQLTTYIISAQEFLNKLNKIILDRQYYYIKNHYRTCMFIPCAKLAF